MIHQYIFGWFCFKQKTKWKQRLIPEARLLIEWVCQRHSSFLLHNIYLYPSLIHLFYSLSFFSFYFSLPIYLYTISMNPAIHFIHLWFEKRHRARGIWYLKSPIFLKAKAEYHIHETRRDERWQSTEKRSGRVGGIIVA